eukprot:CAMPEP_0203744470 /NCGR_PEP_ID=MMETSP0098-20131031/521_1 /ASSEMBLY_ACC=CAM_ASM_000208 /TAXON_ID=96639 /ORGANISM=" , Strain NY0313808BC1" /LENGTH=899 /DNA_ID=CAMNT_0050631985 /DNA_START=330 /DNA_END=3029 /DNA_ORIENTATION=+
MKWVGCLVACSAIKISNGGDACNAFITTTQTCESSLPGQTAATCAAFRDAPQLFSVNQTGFWKQPSCLNSAISDAGLEGTPLTPAYLIQEQALGQNGGILPAYTKSKASEIAVSIILCLYFLIPLAGFLMVIAYRMRFMKDLEDTSVKADAAEGADAIATVSTGGEKDVLPVYVSFHRLTYDVKLNKAGLNAAKEANGGKKPTAPGWDKKTILNNITGVFEPGTLSAIMGPSGCGKSTLLDILADRKHGGYTKGRILINGRERTQLYKRVIGYVMQFDALFPHLTPREVLKYTAELRIPGHDWKKKNDAVNKVIRDLDLHRCADSNIGGNGVPGISGGQARRVTVGIELVTRPMVLFLDEPTTGLDAFSSLQLVRTLRLLADTGRTVICTIHQPRPDIFLLFNTLLLMKAGEIAYFGPQMQIRQYFNLLGIKISQDANVADFVVDLTYSKEDSSDTENVVDKLCDSYNESELSLRLETMALALEERTLENLPAPVASAFGNCDPDTGEVDSRDKGRFSQPVRMQIFVIVRRSYKNMMRDKTYFVNVGVQMSQFLFYGLLFLGLRTQHVTDPHAGDNLNIHNINYLFILQQRAFLFQMMNTMMLIEVVVISNAFVEKKIFRREHASGAYSVFAYHMQWIVRFYVDAIWKGLLAAVLAYWFPPMNLEAQAFFFFVAMMMLSSTMGSSLAFMMVSLVPNAEGAANIHSQILGTFGLYSGFFLFPNVLPVWMKWLYYMLPFKYSFEALERNQFTCVTVGEERDVFALDPTLNRWTNMLVFMFYPPIFHGVAVAASFLHTRPKSYWVKHCKCFFGGDEVGDSGDLEQARSRLIQKAESIGESQSRHEIELGKLESGNSEQAPPMSTQDVKLDETPGSPAVITPDPPIAAVEEEEVNGYAQIENT